MNLAGGVLTPIVPAGQRLMNYVFYLYAAAGTLDASTAPFVLTAATAKLGILIEFLFGWLLNLAEF